MVPPDRPEGLRQPLGRPWPLARSSLIVGLTLGGVACGSSDYRTNETPDGPLDSAGIRLVESLGPKDSEVTIEGPVVLVAGYG